MHFVYIPHVVQYLSGSAYCVLVCLHTYTCTHVLSERALSCRFGIGCERGGKERERERERVRKRERERERESS